MVMFMQILILVLVHVLVAVAQVSDSLKIQPKCWSWCTDHRVGLGHGVDPSGFGVGSCVNWLDFWEEKSFGYWQKIIQFFFSFCWCFISCLFNSFTWFLVLIWGFFFHSFSYLFFVFFTHICCEIYMF